MNKTWIKRELTKDGFADWYRVGVLVIIEFSGWAA